MRAVLTTLALGAFLALAGASATFAKETSHTFSGAIAKVDPAAKTLVVKQKGNNAKEMTFSVAPEAKILAGAKIETLAVLKPGDQVKVTYSDHAGMHRAEHIKIKNAKTAAAPAPKPTEKSTLKY